MAVEQLSWKSPSDLFELREKGATDLHFAGHVDSGELADLVRFVAERGDGAKHYAISCAARSFIGHDEIVRLARRPDFPRRG